MKNIILIIIFIVVSFGAYSQKLSIELSIEWQKERVYLKTIEGGEKEIPVPYLCITYKNISEENLILRKIENNEYYLSNVSLIMFNTTMDYDERVMHINNYSSGKYIYELGSFIIEKYSTHIEYDSLNEDIEIEQPIINSDLFDIFSVLTTQRELNNNETNKQLRCFNYPNKEFITFREARNILWEHNTKLSSEFDNILTLKAKQIKKQRLSLLGYLAVKGNFTFRIAEHLLILPNFPDIVLKGEKYKPIKINDISANSIQISLK